MILNARLETEQSVASRPPILLIHGLFGSLDNLGGLARGVRDARPTLRVDVRNHGFSARSDVMNYHAMAQDIVDTLDAHQIERASVIGHSMGGKIAMALSAVAPQRIDKMALIDIAPVDYQTRRHDEIFAGIRAVTAAGVTRRSEAANVIRHYIAEEGTIQFILKSFVEGAWRFNVPVLWDNYTILSGWEEVPTWPHPVLFIRGGNSPYLDNQHRDALLRQFPQAQAHVISGAGHWVHAEKPEAVLRAVRRFFKL